MIKIFCITLTLLVPLNVYPNENLLTIQQQIDRLQREVSDLTKTIFSNSENANFEDNSQLVNNLSAIDMRIYDLEKDLKNLTANIEDISFILEDLILKINNFDEMISFQEKKIFEIENNQSGVNDKLIIDENKSENSLGTLNITKKNVEDTSIEKINNDTVSINDESTQKIIEPEIVLSPEEQFQLAFDNIRSKNYEDAKNSLLTFIDNYSDNQLSGSAYYWLGELYILDKNFKDATLTLADGFQKFPDSVKAPDMLFKLSLSLFEIQKTNESCATLKKLIIDFPKNKMVKNANKKLQEYGCLETNE